MGSLEINEQPDVVYDLLCGDADAVCYRAGFATKEGEPVNHAIHNVNLILSDIREACPAKAEVLYLTSNDKTNFRFARATIPRIVHAGKPKEYQLLGYKENRKKAEKPEHYDAIRTYLVEQEAAIVIFGAEADDAMAYAATRVLSNGGRAIISTHDKDLNMVPVDVHSIPNKTISVYDFDKYGTLGFTELTDKRKLYGRGIAWFYAQMIMGDTGDNIPGIPGYGPVKAYNAIKTCMTELEYFDVTWELYKEHQVGLYTAVQDWFLPQVYDAAKRRFMEVAALLWMQIAGCKDIEQYLEKEYFNEI